MGDNTLLGTGYKNSLEGGGGDDLLRGWGGKDILSGDKGNDTLIGGTGEDRFVFATGGDRDVIRDFDARGDTHDVLDIRGLLAVHSYRDLVHNHLKQIGDDAVIFGHNGDAIILRDVQIASLDAGDFLI
jgi:Ca2+-binding RTX toxin-like protein